MAEEKELSVAREQVTIPTLRDALRNYKLRSNVDRVFDECNIQAQIQWAVYTNDERLAKYADRIIKAAGFAPTEETKRRPFFAFRVLAEYEFRRNVQRYQMANWEAVPFITAQLLEKFRAELKQQLADFKAKRSAQSGKAQMMCNRLNMPEKHTHATYRAAYLWALRKLEHPETKTPVKEKPVSNKPYETIDYVYGKNLEQATADDLIEAIRRVRAEINSLKPLEDSKSKHITKKIEELQVAEAKIVKALDAKK